jgi:hypothetical protein
MSSPAKKRRNPTSVNKPRSEGNAPAPQSTKRSSARKSGKHSSRQEKFGTPERSPLASLVLTVLGVWMLIGGLFIAHGLMSGTLLPEWLQNIVKPGKLTMEQIEPGDGQNVPKVGDEVQIEYTATVTATGKTFDSSQGRGPMKFEVGQEPPKALLGLDIGVRNMSLGETAEIQVTSAFAFGQRAIGEGENMVPPNSDITFEVTLVAINDLLAPEPEEEEEFYEDLWDDLGEEEKTAAGSLGWTQENWGKHTELTKTPFADLTEAQQEAVEVLGYDEETWEDPDEFKSASAAEDADDSADDDDDGTDEE